MDNIQQPQLSRHDILNIVDMIAPEIKKRTRNSLSRVELDFTMEEKGLPKYP